MGGAAFHTVGSGTLGYAAQGSNEGRHDKQPPGLTGFRHDIRSNGQTTADVVRHRVFGVFYKRRRVCVCDVWRHSVVK